VKIKPQSGFKWDEERGANIDESTAVVWEAYEKVCSLIFGCIATSKSGFFTSFLFVETCDMIM
jgi:hypothetical protein